jgi:hypothetical protein
MRLADIFTAVSVGVLTTGIGVSVVLTVMGIINHRATIRAERGVRDNSSVMSEKFLNWLTRFILGPKRLDHEPMYSCVIAAIWLVSVFWLGVGPLPQSVIFSLPDTTQLTVATCMLVGSSTCLYGITMGTPFDVRRRIVGCIRRRHGRPPLFPLDLRYAYLVGSSGTPPLIVSLGYYTFALIRDTKLVWTGSNVLFLGFICLGMFFHWLRFLMENRRINLALPVLLQHELNRRRIAGGLSYDQPPEDTLRRRWWQP